MLTSTNGFAKKLLSAFIACALAITMTPLPSAAFATESAPNENAQTASSTDNAGTTDDASADVADAETANTDVASSADATADRVYKAVDLKQSDATEESSSATDEANDDTASVPVSSAQSAATDPEDIEMTQVQIALGDEAAPTVITYAGLTYTVNEDGTTVTLTGWSGKAPAGDVHVPAQITSGQATYAVTNICTLRGGVFANC